MAERNVEASILVAALKAWWDPPSCVGCNPSATKIC